MGASFEAVTTLNCLWAIVLFVGGVIIEAFATVAGMSEGVGFVEEVDHIEPPKNAFVARVLVAFAVPAKLWGVLRTLLLLVPQLPA